MFGKNVRCIGIVSPAGAVDGEKLLKSVISVESAGIRVKVSPHALGKRGYLSGTAEERFSDLAEMWADDEVDLVLSSRGGFGCAHLLPLLERLPKIARTKYIGGYSDLTSLLFAFDRMPEAVPVAMPMAARLAELDAESASGIAPALDGTQRNFGRFETLRPGSCSGLPLPMNLTVAASMAGTRWAPDTRGRVLVIEDVGEPLYRIDRSLTQLEQCGWFKGCAGIVFGGFTGPEIDPLELRRLLAERTASCPGPVAAGFRFSHEFPFDSINYRQTVEISSDGAVSAVQ